MKVLVVSQQYWPETFRINDVVDSLRQAGAEVTVLTGQPNYPEGRIFDGYRATRLTVQLHPSGYHIHRLPIVPRAGGGPFRLIANYISFVAAGCLLAPWTLRGQKFDVIFVYGVSPILQAIPAVLLKFLKRAALVVWVQDLWPQSLEATGYVKSAHILSLVGKVTSWIYRRCSLILVQSPPFVEPVRALAGGHIEIDYHPNPGDDKQHLRDVGNQGPSLSPGFNIVFAGNLGTAQALPTLLGAAKILASHQDIRFVIVGSGSRSGWIKEQIESNAIGNVELIGRFPSEAMPQIYAQSSVLLVSLASSHIYEKTIPSKLATYLAAGRPIIACADGETARVVNEAQAGLTAPAEDETALAAAIVALRAMSAEQREAFGRRGRTYYEEHYEPKMLTTRLVAQFRRAMKLHRPRQDRRNEQ